MKTNIFKIIAIAVLPVMIVGCHSGAAQTTETNGQDSATSKGRDTMRGTNLVKHDSNQSRHDTARRNVDSTTRR